MELRGIDFGHVFTSSGARGFFGEGYRHSSWPPWSFTDDRGATFISKTVTWQRREGHMPLQDDGLTTKEFFPQCIIAMPRHGAVLNAVGLSNFGAEHYFGIGHWDRIEEPFFISYMGMGDAGQCANELVQFAVLLKKHMPNFRAKVGLELNYSCPNVGQKHDDLVKRVMDDLDTVKRLGIPIMPNFNPLIEPSALAEISHHSVCDAVSVANSVPWGARPDLIDWKGIFGSDVSPLARFDKNGGGLSGRPIFPVVTEWLNRVRFARIKKPLVIGGGIMSIYDAETILRLGFPIVKGVKIGVVRILHPWRVQGIIRHVNAEFSRRNVRCRKS